MTDFNVSVHLGAKTSGTDRMQAFRKALDDVVQTAKGAGDALTGSFGGIGGSLNEATVSATGFTGAFVEAELITKAILKTVEKITDVLGELTDRGLKMNEFLESSTTGLAANLVAQYKIADASGKNVDGMDAYNIAIGMAKDQMDQLRKAGLQTAATTKELVAIFNAAIANGAQAGITDINKLRDLTVKLSLASTAVGATQEEAITGMRAILTGREVEYSKVARTVVLNSQTARQWREQGKLVEELDKRLDSYASSAKQAAGNWAIIKSNIQEVLDLFSGNITTGLFAELKNAGNAIMGVIASSGTGIIDTYQPVISFLRDGFTGVGVVLREGIEGSLVALAKIGEFLSTNKTYIDEWEQGFHESWIATKLLLSTLGQVLAALFGIGEETGQVDALFTDISILLKTIALLIAGIADGVRLVASIVLYIGSLIYDDLLSPIELVMLAVGKIGKVMGADWGEAMMQSAEQLNAVGVSMRKAASGLFAPFKDGTSAVGRLMESFEETGKVAETAAAKTKKALGAVTGAAHPTQNQRDINAAIKLAEAVAKAKSTVALAAEKDRLARETQLLNEELAHQKISIMQYYKDLAASQTAAVQADINTKKLRLSQLTKKTDEPERIKLQGDINLLRLKEGDIIRENALKSADAMRQLNDAVADVQNQIAEITGSQTIDTITAQLVLKFRKLKDQLIAEFGADSTQVGLVDKLINLTAAKNTFAALKTEYEQTLNEMQQKEDAISKLQEKSAIAPVDAQRQLDAIHKQYSQTLSELIPKLEAYANTVGSQELINQVAKMKTNVEQLNQTQSEFATTMANEVNSQWVTMWENFTNGTMTAQDAFRSFAQNVLSTFTKLITDMLAKAAMLKLLEGLGQGSGGWASIFQSMYTSMAGKADGGYISGPGSSTSDSIPARLSNGEYVLRAAAVRSVGVPFLNALNGGKIRSRSGYFAEGGLAVAASGGSFKGSLGVTLSPGLILEYLQSDEAVDIQVKNTSRNPKKFRNALGG